jgi:hypothetical protein
MRQRKKSKRDGVPMTDIANPPLRLAEIITSMDFSGKQQPTVYDEIRELKELILAKKRVSNE